MKQTYMTRKDSDVGVGLFDSIKWIFETHLRETDTDEYNFAILYGNEDSPSRIDFWRNEPDYDSIPDRTWYRFEEES